MKGSVTMENLCRTCYYRNDCGETERDDVVDVCGMYVEDEELELNDEDEEQVNMIGGDMIGL